MAPHLIIAFGHVSTACCCSLRVHVKACPVDPAGSQLLCLAHHSSAQAVAASRASPGLSRRGSGFILYPRRFGMLGAPPADSLLMPSATSCRKSALTRPSDRRTHTPLPSRRTVPSAPSLHRCTWLVHLKHASVRPRSTSSCTSYPLSRICGRKHAPCPFAS
jgi:hypothetical protein